MSAPAGATGKRDAKDRAAAASITVAIAQARERKAQAAAEYEVATKNLYFTKDFNTDLEAMMRDELAPDGQRYLAWAKRYSWGEYALHAIAVDGFPKHQVDAARELGIDKTRISHVHSYYVQRGYLHDKGKLISPVLAPVLGPAPGKLSGNGNYEQFLEDWKVANSSNFQELEVARSTVKRISKQILSDYKKSRESARKASASLYKSARPLPDPAKLKSSTPFEDSNQRARQKEEAKTDSADGWQQSDAREFLFNEIARMQQTFPKSSFAQPPIDPENPEHQNLVDLILQKIGRYEEEHVIGFVVWVAAEFKGLGARRGDAYKRPGASRAPGTDSGPATLGLLVLWAGDYGRIAGGK